MGHCPYGPCTKVHKRLLCRAVVVPSGEVTDAIDSQVDPFASLKWPRGVPETSGRAVVSAVCSTFREDEGWVASFMS